MKRQGPVIFLVVMMLNFTLSIIFKHEIQANGITMAERLLIVKEGSDTTLLDTRQTSRVISRQSRKSFSLITGLNAGKQDAPKIIHVKDFGAFPDDNQDDIQAINNAIDAAKKESSAIVMFDAGTYNLKDKSKMPAKITIDRANNITLSGQVTSQGDPATILEMDLTLGNDIVAGRHIDIKNSQNVKIENIVMDHNPRPNTAGEVVAIDKCNDVVIVDILPGLPHFDSMKFYSANSWDLSTKELLPIAPLSIGVNKEKFSHVWEHIPSDNGRRYKLKGFGITNMVEVGQGISWHFNVKPEEGESAPNVIRASSNKDLTIENVYIYSAVGAVVAMPSNENITLKKVRLIPQGNSLVVSPRDGFHLSRNTGKLLVEDIYIKGCRWDPFVSYMQFLNVQEVTGENSITSLLNAAGQKLKAGDNITFWAGERAVDRTIQSIAKNSGNEYSIVLTEALPSSVVKNSKFTPQIWDWEEAIVRNSLFEGNCGTPLIFETSNVLIENNIFRNNSYSNIELGPTSSNAASFVRNVIIKNNEFIKSTWTTKSSGQVEGGTNYGSISVFNKNPDFSIEPYNENIVIENNTFKDINMGNEYSAIHLKNAQDVELNGNEYINVTNRLIVDPASTKNIIDNDN